ncbi:GerAB/ArcD/ProY family transporter [Lysinibacillus telephonicus]|uniref:Spore gernimation protein n=1 Tax=Lysinibacillus telephonicus TaxID=1714840 RepID=A0A431UUV2_9BACI|nr:endospore germination permease [Lysinibacillus telephonicus]RTQ94510.1 spore gernimation protein [Lysinibacillus telephonicus]
MEKIYITKIQALMLGITSITVTGHLLYISVIINHSGRDSWIALLLAIFPAILIGFTVALLSQRYQGYSLVEYCQLILGKALGKFVVILFLIYFLHEVSLSIRGFGEFYTSAVTLRTPISIFLIAILILAGYAVRCGLEVIARTNQTILIMLIPIGILASILTHKDKDYRNFLPILDNSMGPVLDGTLAITSLYSSIFVLSMIFPFVNSTKQLKRYSILTMIILIIMFIGPVTGVLAIYGEERATGLYFPTFLTLRDIQIGALQRLDILGILLWSLGSFAKVALFLYAIVLGTGQLFKLDDYKVLVVPIAALISIISIINSEDFIGIARFLNNYYPYYATFVGLILPLVLLIISQFRKPGGKREGRKKDV